MDEMNSQDDLELLKAQLINISGQKSDILNILNYDLELVDMADKNDSQFIYN